MGLKESLVDIGFKGLNTFHRSVLRLGGGRIGRSAFGMKVVALRTTCRRSGLIRVTMLTAPIVESDMVVLVASKGGDDRDPDWYRNVVAHADIELTIDGDRMLMRAHAATPEEKARLWPRVVSAYKPYASYQRRSKRDIPLVICRPRS